ncbi:MAG: hypothetical protein MUE98_00925 [Rhodobacteraceae bacterium]|jgi:hypothetical protein|nr:hypothetical protein [Paracoccaceae bacterium]
MISPIQFQPVSPAAAGNDTSMQIALAGISAQSKNDLALNMRETAAINQRLTRRQIEIMLANAERALSNESSSRVLSQMFGRFSLLQKLMQSMN